MLDFVEATITGSEDRCRRKNADERWSRWFKRSWGAECHESKIYRAPIAFSSTASTATNRSTFMPSESE
jgi:hypothetical protein